MSPRLSFPLIVLLAAWSAGPVCLPLHAREPNEKAARILEPLLKRPASGPLFERFVNAWLDTATLEELGGFLTKRMEADPSSANRLLLALFHSREGEPVKALEQFRAALATNPGSADIWYQKALLESRTLDFEAAIASLGRCLEAKPSGELPLQAAQLLGRLQARAGRTEEALKTWRALMDSRPADEELREDILELQISESLWPAARETAEALVEKTADPYRRVLRRMRLGDVLDRAGRRDKALETFAACLTDTGAGSWLEKEILSQIEKLFRREDDLSGLRACFAALLEKHAHRAGLQRAQARLLMEAGETEAAIACGRALMALSPGDRSVREEFIALLTGAGRAAEAIPQVEQLLAQAPQDLELRLSLADLKHAVKDTAGALAALRGYAQMAGEKEGAVLRVAGLMDRYSLTDEAVKTLRAALAAKDQPEARLMLASMLHKSGDRDGALTEWKTLAASGAPAAVQQAARAMQAHSETKSAWELMQSAAPRAGNDPVFLTQLCALADDQERAAAALEPVRRLVELSRSAPDLNSALDVALRITRLSGKADGFAAELAQSAVSAQALCLLATLREAARDTIGANAALEKARALSPDLALAQLVRLWTMRGDFAQAAAVAENLFNSPGGRQGHVAEILASLHQRAGNPEAALRWTQEWRRLVPGATAPVLGEARLLEYLDREAEALAALRTAAGRFENNEDIRARLASLSLDTGRTAEALRYFSTLYEEAADLTAKMRWLTEWGEAARQAGQLEGLISQFEDRRRENRGTVAPLMALAELHRIADNYEARRNALTEAARLKPDDPEIALEIARLESRENDEEAAIRTLRPMLGKDSSGRVAALLADLLINSGQLEEGLRLLTESTAASPGAVELAALSLARRDEEKTALTFLRPHLSKMPDDWRLHYLAALLEWRTGEYETAAARLVNLAGASAALPRLGTGMSTQASSGQTYEDLILRIMPPDVRRFFRLIQAAGELTPGNSNPWSYSRQSVYTQLPSDVEEVQFRSVALLLEVAKSAAPEKRETWLAELEQRGFPAVRLYLELPPLRRLQPADRLFDFTALLRAHPDSRPMLAFAGLASAYRQYNLPADPVIAEKVWAAMREDAPQAGVFLALPAAGRGRPPAAWEEEVLSVAEKLPAASPLLIMAAARNTGDSQRADTGNAIPAGWRKRLLGLMERWRAQMDAAGGATRGYAENMRAYGFRSLAEEYANDKATESLAALLESEWRWQSGRPQPPMRSPSNEDLAQPLGFPPWFLPGLPETLRDFMQRNLTPEVAAQTAPKVKEPLLRVLLASKARGEAADAAMKEVQAGSATTAIPYILGASWAEKRGDFGAAAEQAVKALYLPVSQETRRRLDGALAYWASKKGQPGEALYLAGREAALRLRRDAVTDQRRAELATLMDRLGLTAEADRLMRQGKAEVAAAVVDADERLQRLLDEGKTKEALPTLIGDLRGWTRERLNHANYPSYEAVIAWRERVQVNGLLPQVMQALLPQKATPQQLAEYAVACELTGETAHAREYYEQALAAGVRKKVPLLLLILTLHTDANRAESLLKEFPDLWSLENVRRWVPVLGYSNDRRASMEEVVAYIAFMTKVLDFLPRTFESGFPADTVLEIAVTEAWSGDFCQTQQVVQETEPVFRGDPPPEERQRVQALFTARYDGCVALARRLMTIPGCGLDAWDYLQNLWTSRKKDTAELLSEGMAMLAREVRIPSAKRTSNNDETRMQTLCFRLMQEASSQGRTAEFARLIVPAVQSSRSPLAAASFLKAWPLYETVPEQFAAVARELVKKNGRTAWTDIIPAAAHRKLGASLAPDLKDVWTHPDPKQDEALDFLFGDWCACLYRIQGREAAEQFFHEVVEDLLGPPGERAALFKDAASSRLQAVRRMVPDAAEGREWAGFVLRWVRDVWLPLVPKDAPYPAMENAFSEHVLGTPVYPLFQTKDFAGLKAYLDSLPAMEDLSGFFCVSGDMMTGLSRALGELPEDKRAELGFGKEEKNLTFGRRVLRGLMNRWFTGVCEELAGWEPRIEALPEAQRTRVLAFLRSFDATLYYDITPEGRSFHTWLTKEQRAKEKEELEQSLKTFFTTAAGGGFENEEEMVTRLKTLLYSLGEAQDPRGREVILAAHRAAEGFGPREYRSLLLDALIEPFAENRMAWGRTTNLPWQAGLLAAALRTGEPPASIFENYILYIGTGMGLNNNDEDDNELLEDFVNRFGPFLQKGDAQLLMLWALHSAASGRASRYEAMRKGLEAMKGKTPHEEMRHELEVALRLYSPDSTFRGITDEAALPAEQIHFLGILRDSSLPAPLRLAMGTGLLILRGEVLEPPLILEVARQLHQALAERRNVSNEQEGVVFGALAGLPPALRDAALEKSLLSLTSLPRLRGSSYSYNVTGGLLALLDMALRHGDQAIVDRLMELDGEFPSVGALTVLARHGESKRIAALVKDRPKTLQSIENSSGPLVSWDTALAAQMPGVLSEIADPLVRFEAITRLTVRPDAGPLPPGLKPHPQRCAELAAAFSTIPWRSPQVKDRVVDLTVWWNEPPPAAVLPFMEESTRRVPLAAVPQTGGGSVSTGFHAALITRALTEGNGQPLLDAMRILDGVSMPRPDYTSNFRSSLLSTVNNWLLEQWGGMTPDARGAACTVWRDLLVQLKNPAARAQLDRQAHFAVLLHSLAGRMEDLRAWQATLSNTQRAGLRLRMEEVTAGDFLAELDTHLNQIPGTPDEKAARLREAFLALSTNPVGGRTGYWSRQEFLKIEGATPAEFLKLEEPLTAARPEDGWVAFAFAAAHAETDAWDRVLTRTDAVLPKVKPERDSAYAPLLELRTRALEKLGRPGETIARIKALASLPPTQDYNAGAQSVSRAAERRLQKRLTPPAP